MTENTEGKRGPSLSPTGQWALGRESWPWLPSRPTGLLRSLGHALILSTRCFRIPVSASPPRISGSPARRAPRPPDVHPCPVEPRSRARFPISFPHLLGLGGPDATRDELGSTRPPPSRRALAHPAAAFSNLSASVSSMMRLFTSSRIMAAAAPGRGRRNKGGEGGRARAGRRGSGPAAPDGGGWVR